MDQKLMILQPRSILKSIDLVSVVKIQLKKENDDCIWIYFMCWLYVLEKVFLS